MFAVVVISARRVKKKKKKKVLEKKILSFLFSLLIKKEFLVDSFSEEIQIALRELLHRTVYPFALNTV